MEQFENAAHQNDDAAALESLFIKYKERDEKKSKFKSKEEILAKHFNPRKDTEYFRALPKRENEEIIEEGFFHKVQAGEYATNYTTVYCLAKNDPKVQQVDGDGNLVFDQNNKPVMIHKYCPLCAKAAYYKSKQDPTLIGKKENEITDPRQLAIFKRNKELFKEATKYEAKRYYIIRGIDRGAEKDGVKFWRFKENFKKQGVHDKLFRPIISEYYKQTGKMYYDVNEGIDLVISVVDNSMPGSTKTFRDVSAINPNMRPTPLHHDPVIAKQWLDDKITWREVFKPKKAPGIDEVKYLELAAEERQPGQKIDMRCTPYYNEQQKKWVFPNHPELEVAANTKNRNLDADNGDDEDVNSSYEDAAVSVFNQVIASDITEMSTTPIIESTPNNFGSVDMSTPTSQGSEDVWNDLPF